MTSTPSCGPNPKMGDSLMARSSFRDPSDTHESMLRMLGLSRETLRSPLSPNLLVPTDALSQHLRHREWAAAKHRLAQFPWDSRYRQGNRATSLHLACFYRAPHNLIARIVEAYPQALLEQDTEGWTPLHVHLLYGTNTETAVMLIRRGGNQAASLHARLVGSPLHLACRHWCCPEILEALVEMGPQQVCRRNEAGCYPASLLYKSALRQQHTFACASRDIFARLALLVMAARDGAKATEETPKPLSLHEIIAFQCEYAHDTDLIGLSLDLDPEAAQRVDAIGRLPLHIAASFPPPPRPSFMATARRNIPGDPLDNLLKSYGLAALHTDSQGRLPLHMAIQHGRHWRTGVNRLVAAGSRLDQTCLDTGLFLFQLAATAMSGEIRQEDECSALETVYELLRACPHVMDPSRAVISVGLITDYDVPNMTESFGPYRAIQHKHY